MKIIIKKTDNKQIPKNKEINKTKLKKLFFMKMLSDIIILRWYQQVRPTFFAILRSKCHMITRSRRNSVTVATKDISKDLLH